MNGAEVSVPRRSFGQTMRPDVWWTQPLLVFLGLSIFIVYSTWAAFQGTHYFFGNYISPFYSPEIFGDSPHNWFGSKPDWWPKWLLFLQRSSFSGRRADSDSPAIIIEGRITKRFGPIRLHARSVNRARLILASVHSRSSCKTCTATFFISRSFSSSFSLST